MINENPLKRKDVKVIIKAEGHNLSGGSMKNIVFDFGGVLIDWNPRYLYRKIFSSTEEMEWFLNNICTPEWNSRQDAGRSFAQGISELKAKYPRYSAQIDDYYLRWEEMLGGLIKGSVEIMKELYDQGYRIYGLTNWSAETISLAKDRYNFFPLLSGLVVSGEEKTIKPDSTLYKILLERYRLDPAETLFIDDKTENTIAAAKLGMKTIDFHSPVQLRLELVRKGLLPAQKPVLI